MEVVHYNELRDFAHRGPVERGLRYVRCLNRTQAMCGPEVYYLWDDNDNVTAQRLEPYTAATEYVAASGIEYHDYISVARRMGQKSVFEDPIVGTYSSRLALERIHQKQPMFFYYDRDFFNPRKLVLRNQYASSAGLTEVPGVEYDDPAVWLLDVNALLRRGIRIAGAKSALR